MMSTKPAGRTAPTEGVATGTRAAGRVRRFHAEARAAFARAAGERRRPTLSLGGDRVALAFAGPAMADAILPALAPRVMVGRDPEAPGAAPLTLEIWDSASSGVAMPASPWGPDAFVQRAEIAEAGDEPGMHVSYNAGSGVLSLLDLDAGRGMLWTRDAASLPYYERAAPLRTLLHWWFAARGLQLVHGAAVGTGGAAVLLGGRGGSGKSTTALAALFEGLEFLGDDYVLCAPDRVHALYATAKLDARSLALVPEAAAHVAIPPGEPGAKSVLALDPAHRPRLPGSAALRAIAIPRVVARRESRLVPLGQAAAFLELAPTTVFQLPGAGAGATAFLRDLVTRLPCYRLEVGSDRAGPAQALAGLLERAP